MDESMFANIIIYNYVRPYIKSISTLGFNYHKSDSKWHMKCPSLSMFCQFFWQIFQFSFRDSIFCHRINQIHLGLIRKPKMKIPSFLCLSKNDIQTVWIASLFLLLCKPSNAPTRSSNFFYVSCNFRALTIIDLYDFLSFVCFNKLSFFCLS